MRSVFSGSYSALNNQGSGREVSDFDGENGVYRSTTRPSFDGGDLRVLRQQQQRNEKSSVISSMKKFFGGTSNGARLTASQSVFVLPNIHEHSTSFVPQVHVATGRTGVNYNRFNSRERKRMPTSVSMEEAALLGCHPSESMDEVELKNIQFSSACTKSLASVPGQAVEERVETKFGSVLVAIQGNRAKPAILTYHDIGLNYGSNFLAFFNYPDMRILLDSFCVYHVNAPGQEEHAPTLPETYVYPTMDELAEQVLEVMAHYGLKRIIGLGVGAGANILCRFSLAYPDKVDALCVLNCMSTQAGWIEWGYQKINARNLRKGVMTQGVMDYLMWHHFGRVDDDRNHDLTFAYREQFQNRVNPVNLGLFIDSYIRRTDLNITRELDLIRKKSVRTLLVPVLNVTGALSPHVDDTVTFNGRLDPVNSTWMKLQDCGLVMEEQPGKLSEAFRLFLQGQGYVPCLSSKKISNNRKMSVDSGAGSSTGSLNGNGSSTPGAVFSTPKLQPTSGILINLSGGAQGTSTGSGSPGSADSALTASQGNVSVEQALADIHITENPISQSSQGQVETEASYNPKC